MVFTSMLNYNKTYKTPIEKRSLKYDVYQVSTLNIERYTMEVLGSLVNSYRTQDYFLSYYIFIVQNKARYFIILACACRLIRNVYFIQISIAVYFSLKNVPYSSTTILSVIRFWFMKKLLYSHTEFMSYVFTVKQIFSSEMQSVYSIHTILQLHCSVLSIFWKRFKLYHKIVVSELPCDVVFFTAKLPVYWFRLTREISIVYIQYLLCLIVLEEENMFQSHQN